MTRLEAIHFSEPEESCIFNTEKVSFANILNKGMEDADSVMLRTLLFKVNEMEKNLGNKINDAQVVISDQLKDIRGIELLRYLSIDGGFNEEVEDFLKRVSGAKLQEYFIQEVINDNVKVFNVEISKNLKNMKVEEFYELEEKIVSWVEEMKLGLTIRRANDTLRNSCPPDVVVLVNEIIKCQTARQLVEWFNGMIQGGESTLTASHIVANTFLCSMIHLGQSELDSEAFQDEKFLSNFEDFLKLHFDLNWGTTLQKGFEVLNIILRPNLNDMRFAGILCNTLQERKKFSLSVTIQLLKCVEYISEGQNSIKTLFLDSDVCSLIVDSLRKSTVKLAYGINDDYLELLEQAFLTTKVLAMNHEKIRAGLAKADFPSVIYKNLNFLLEYQQNEKIEKKESLKPSSKPDIVHILTLGLQAVRQAISGADGSLVHHYIEIENTEETIQKILKSDRSFESDAVLSACLGVIKNLAIGNYELKANLGMKIADEVFYVFQNHLISTDIKDNISLEACVSIRNLCVGCAENKILVGKLQDIFFGLKNFLLKFLNLKSSVLEGLMLLQSLLLLRSNILYAQQAAIQHIVKTEVKTNYTGDAEITKLCDAVLTLSNPRNFFDDTHSLVRDETSTEEQRSFNRPNMIEDFSFNKEEAAGIEFEKLYAPEQSDLPGMISLNKSGESNKAEVPKASQSFDSTRTGNIFRLLRGRSDEQQSSAGGDSVPLIDTSIVDRVGNSEPLTVWVVTNRAQWDKNFGSECSQLEQFYLIKYTESDESEMTLKYTHENRLDDLKSTIANLNDEENALVYVHGFNNTLDDAVCTGRLYAKELRNVVKVMIVFSWPSAGCFFFYDKDQRNAEASRLIFRDILDELCRDGNAPKLNLIMHSMGNHLAVPSLVRFKSGKIKNVFFAAADYDRDSFVEAVKNIFKDTLASRMICYISSADRALQISKSVNGKLRAGLFDPTEITLTGLNEFCSLLSGPFSSDKSYNQHGYHTNSEVINHMIIQMSDSPNHL